MVMYCINVIVVIYLLLKVLYCIFIYCCQLMGQKNKIILFFFIIDGANLYYKKNSSF